MHNLEFRIRIRRLCKLFFIHFSFQGGWDALCDAFPVQEDVETRLWRTLVHLGLGLGLLALYLVYRK
jgi:hypothetical protein